MIGPTIECINKTKWWYKEGKLHRLDGPAVEWADGDKEWYKEDLSHRVDGPADEFANGDKNWYLLNKDLKEKEFNSWILRIRKFI